MPKTDQTTKNERKAALKVMKMRAEGRNLTEERLKQVKRQNKTLERNNKILAGMARAVVRKHLKELSSCGLLSIDFRAGTMRFNANPSIEISPSTREMKLLRLLLSRHGETVEYWELAKELKLPIYREANSNNRKYARDIQMVRRDLIEKFLKPAGMGRQEIKQMIQTKTKLGYALRCPPP